MTFHELSDQLFDVSEKLTSDEYNKMYNLLMQLERQNKVVDTVDVEDSEDVEGTAEDEDSLKDESYLGLWKMLFELVFDDCVEILRGIMSPTVHGRSPISIG